MKITYDYELLEIHRSTFSGFLDCFREKFKCVCKKLGIAASAQLSATIFCERVAVNKLFPLLEYEYLQVQKGLLGIKSYKLFPCLMSVCIIIPIEYCLNVEVHIFTSSVKIYMYLWLVGFSGVFCLYISYVTAPSF